jgi:hypothetical protein
MNTVRLLVLASFVHLIVKGSLISLFTKQHSLLMNVMLGVIMLNVVPNVMVPFFVYSPSGFMHHRTTVDMSTDNSTTKVQIQKQKHTFGTTNNEFNMCS